VRISKRQDWKGEITKHKIWLAEKRNQNESNMAEVENPLNFDETVKLLDEAFMMDCSIEEACFLAKISRQTYYNWIESFPEYKERFDNLRSNLRLKAKKNISKELDNGDKDISKWYLERRDKDFKPKSDLTSGDKPIPLANALLDNPKHAEDISVE
jgi:hypothetical protein